MRSLNMVAEACSSKTYDFFFLYQISRELFEQEYGNTEWLF